MSEDKEKNVQIPTDGGGKHHTWGSSTNRGYKGQHRKSERKADEDKKEK